MTWTCQDISGHFTKKELSLCDASCSVLYTCIFGLYCYKKCRKMKKKKQQHQAFTTKGDDARPFLSHLVPTTNSHLLLVIGERHSRAKCLFSLHVFSFLTSICDVQMLGERERGRLNRLRFTVGGLALLRLPENSRFISCTVKQRGLT